ncbi:BlaI/MecI/CopY family transcriptional regulator [Tissierella sp. MB52-C2]|uniref:BlaI/MecI/CopY family transcriptional regulator n=1 Tax=Tissierella sp. MB52-C2 TaxID=3070999 RepID=UPI00280B939D|nr:BlaI/MecI/CopY family transcriptional regulator [Tissierella sp. MB52-C2]WMM26374.1 BlaI/MecI/CopY family transcriptional regulator [Tissierella sp. MB52-C2]
MDNREKTKLTDTEWKIMMLLWEKNPLTCRQIEDDLKEETGWSRHTIISFLKRMQKKNYIRMEEANPARLYYPLLNKDETVLQETRSFVKKIFDGKMGLLVSSLVDSEDITKDEINSMLQSLKEALVEKDEKNE